MNLDAPPSKANTNKCARGRSPRLLLSLVAIPALAMLAACSTPYQPSGLRGGFTQAATAPSTEIVNFTGNGLISEERATHMLLYRCAQITHQNGYSYFIITGDNRGFQSPSNLAAGAYPIPNTSAPPQQAEVGIPGSAGQAYQDPLAAVSAASESYANGPLAVAGYSLPSSPLGIASLAVARGVVLEYEIKMFQGVKPANNPHAFYVSDVFETVGPELGLPTS